MKKSKAFELPPDREFLRTVPEVAGLLGVCTRTVERMLRNGDMESRIVGRRSRRIRNSEVLRYMGDDKQEEQAPAEKPKSQMSFLSSSGGGTP